MREKDDSRVYIKYKDNKKVVKIKSKELTRGCGFYVDENVEEIIIENCHLDAAVWITAENTDAKVILRNCGFKELVVENGKVYLTNINATCINGIDNKTFTLKEDNEVDMDMKIKADTVFINGDLKTANTKIEAEKVIISSSVINTFFDFFIRTKKLNISNSNFKSSTVLSLDYQQALVTETSFNTDIFEINGTRYMTRDKKIVISNDATKNEEYLKSYLWLEFLRNLRDKIKAINEKDYKENRKQISAEYGKRIEEYIEEIEKHKLEIQKLETKIDNERSIMSRNREEAKKILSKRKIGSIEGVVEEKPQQ